MPYIPRNSPLDTQVTPGMVPRAPVNPIAAKPPLPYLGSGKNEAPAGAKKNNKLVSRLNMKDWDVDPLKVLKMLTGEEMQVDEYSRMVSKPSRTT
jgi:hypothetical protein